MAALSHEDCAGWASRTEFTPDIVEALKRASFLLVVLSPNWMASKWCLRQVSRPPDGIRERIIVVGKRHVDPDRRPSSKHPPVAVLNHHSPGRRRGLFGGRQ